ncbi:MAG: hypothetical protein AAB306_01760 [Pseudomonadota bacterium]
MESIKDFFIGQGRCERIKTTPLPRQYAFFYESFCVDLCAVASIRARSASWMGNASTLCSASLYFYDHRNIEIDLRQQLGESIIPVPPEPKDGVLM